MSMAQEGTEQLSFYFLEEGTIVFFNGIFNEDKTRDESMVKDEGKADTETVIRSESFTITNE